MSSDLEEYKVEEHQNHIYNTPDTYVGGVDTIEEILPALQHNYQRISDRFWIMSRMVDPIRIMWDKIEDKRVTRKE